MYALLSRIREALVRTRATPGLTALSRYLKRLSPGDRAIATILGILVLATSVGSIYTLERALLVPLPAHGGSLHEGVLGSPRFVNPLLALSDADRDLVTLTYAGLMGFEKGQLVSVLAESYALSEDGTTYTFTLRDNARFSDGTPVTSEDVAFTIRKAQDPSLKSPEYAAWANVTVDIIDARTIRFTLPEAYAPFLYNTTLGILPAHLWRDLRSEEFPFSTYMTKPIGAGPFRVTRVVNNSDGTIIRYELASFDGYVRNRPYLSRITLSFFSREEELERALASRAIESAYGIVPQENRRSHTALRAPYAQVFGVFFNTDQNPLFQERAVREALSRATDRERIVREVLNGFATPVYGPVPPIFSAPVSAQRTHTPRAHAETSGENSGGERDDALEEARALLEDAGWTFSEETLVWTHEKKGLTLTVTIKTSNVPELKAVAQAIRDDWARLSVPVSIELYEPSDLTQNVIRPRTFDALLFGMVVGREQDLFAFWSSSEREDPGLNVTRYASREVDELLVRLRETTNPEERAELLSSVDALIRNDYPAVFAYAPDFIYAVPNRIKGVTLPQIASPSDRFQGVSLWYTFEESVWPVFANW